MMGYRPQVNICYGFGLDEEDIPERLEDLEEWIDIWAERQGFSVSDWHKSGISIEQHGAEGNFTPVICIEESVLYFDWDTLEDLNTDQFHKPNDLLHEWQRKLKDFCAVMDFPYKEPSWVVAVYYG